MTLATLNYGSMERPGAIAKTHTHTEPAQLIETAHQLFRTVADYLIMQIHSHSDRTDEMFYREAVKVLEPIAAELPSNIDGIVEKYCVDKRTVDCFFASALINVSRADVVSVASGDQSIMDIGYRLAPGKILILGENTRVGSAGKMSEGTIINYGNATHLGNSAESGWLINLGYYNALASRAKNAISLTEQFVQGHHGGHAGGGIHINLNDTLQRSMGDFARGGTFLNFARALSIGARANRGVFINAGTAHNFGDPEANSGPGCRYVNAGKCYAMPAENVSTANALTKKLLRSLKTEARALTGSLKNKDGVPLPELVRSIDWPHYERVIRDYGQRIRESVVK